MYEVSVLTMDIEKNENKKQEEYIFNLINRIEEIKKGREKMRTEKENQIKHLNKKIKRKQEKIEARDKAIKKLTDKIDNQKNQIEDLKDKIDSRLQNKLNN